MIYIKKFKYSLQTVLKYKEKLLDNLKIDLGNLVNKSVDIETQIEKSIETQTNIKSEYESKSETGLNLKELQLYNNYYHSLSKEREKLIVDLERNNLAIDNKKIEISQMNIEITSLEKLKEKQHKVFLKALDKKEEEFLEELSRSKGLIEDGGVYGY